jgi:aminopeptidase N
MLKHLLAGTVTVPDVKLRQLDRWNLVAALIARGDPEAEVLFAAETARDHTGDAKKFAFAARAATPDAKVKQEYFGAYTQAPGSAGAEPEDWLSQSLDPFNSWNQTALTEPYLRAALDQLAEIKRDRKIFYLGVWLDAFVRGQMSPQAENVVKQWLAQPGTDADLRRKVLENSHELERTVQIRQKFPDGGAQ